MGVPVPALQFDTDFRPDTGRPVPVASGIVRVTAPNANRFTFTGTNSFILGEERVSVLDPGPDDDDHLRALLAVIGGREVDAIILTHTHRDHSALAKKLQAATGAPLWFEGRHRTSRPKRLFEINVVGRQCDWGLRPDRVLRDGETINASGIGLEVIATPGHCANHLSFGISGTDMLLSGDHVMGWNSTLVAVPDGSMADYLSSLEKLIAAPYSRYIPAHGGAIADGPGYTRALLGHRRMRNRQVVDGVNAGARRIGDLLGKVYPGISPLLVLAARMTLMAHIEYLADQGEIRAERGLFGLRLLPA